jgi:hypothetical protein
MISGRPAWRISDWKARNVVLNCWFGQARQHSRYRL